MGLVACARSTPVGGTTSAGGTTSSSFGGGASFGGAGGGLDATTTGLGGAGGTGSTMSLCGNGVVDPGEECDDGNSALNDGCSNCKVDCELGAMKDPVNHHCYHLFVMATQAAPAEMFCELWGGQSGLGHLVSISDASEETFVSGLGLGTNTPWMGGGDSVVAPSVYTWYDGTTFQYTDWALGKPDHAGTETCLYMHADGTWDDHDCAATLPGFICERRAAGLMD